MVSTIAFGAFTETRKTQAKGQSSTTRPGLGTYIDVFAALIPAEVLAAHALILTLATETTTAADGRSAVVITEKEALKATFFALLVGAALLFLVGRWLKADRKAFDWRWDILRMSIPPTAFLGWTMIQKNTAFDAVSGWSGNSRAIVAVLGAVFLSALVGVLGIKADREDP
jgi:hypothetical protein